MMVISKSSPPTINFMSSYPVHRISIFVFSTKNGLPLHDEAIFLYEMVFADCTSFQHSTWSHTSANNKRANGRLSRCPNSYEVLYTHIMLQFGTASLA